MRQTQSETDGRIRIAYVLSAEERGGVEEHVLSLVRSLDRTRFEPFVVAPPRLIELFGGDLAGTGATLLPLKLSGLHDAIGCRRFVSFIREHSFALVNTHMFTASIRFSPLARMAGVPVLLETSHGVEKWRLEKGFIKRHSFVIDRLFSRLQDRILAVSHACCEDLVKIKKIHRQKITVIQNGRDLSTFSPLPRQRRDALRAHYGVGCDEFVFGVMARLDFQKGHNYLFEAVKLLSADRGDFRVLVIGDGLLRDELKQQVRDLGLERLVTFTGFQRDIPGHHGILDVNVLPSLYEGLPLGLIEASAMEKPVIATRVDGTPEVIADGETGILVPARNPQALAQAMRYALEHKEEMVEMGRRGRELALKQFTLERQVRETEALYLSLLREAASRAPVP